jgi:hypothetical protein
MEHSHYDDLSRPPFFTPRSRSGRRTTYGDLISSVPEEMPGRPIDYYGPPLASGYGGPPLATEYRTIRVPVQRRVPHKMEYVRMPVPEHAPALVPVPRQEREYRSDSDRGDEYARAFIPGFARAYYEGKLPDKTPLFKKGDSCGLARYCKDCFNYLTPREKLIKILYITFTDGTYLNNYDIMCRKCSYELSQQKKNGTTMTSVSTCFHHCAVHNSRLRSKPSKPTEYFIDRGD